jgi:hypothetical protein
MAQEILLDGASLDLSFDFPMLKYPDGSDLCKELALSLPSCILSQSLDM